MFYLAETATGKEAFSAAALGTKTEGSQIEAVLVKLLTGPMARWRQAKIEIVPELTPSPTHAIKDITLEIVASLVKVPGNPLKFRDPATGWCPSEEQAGYLDGVTPIAGMDDLRLAIGRVPDNEAGRALIVPRLMERTGVAEICTVSQGNRLGDATWPVLVVEMPNLTVQLNCPFTFPELVQALTVGEHGADGWAVDTDAAEIEI